MFGHIATYRLRKFQGCEGSCCRAHYVRAHYDMQVAKISGIDARVHSMAHCVSSTTKSHTPLYCIFVPCTVLRVPRSSRYRQYHLLSSLPLSPSTQGPVRDRPGYLFLSFMNIISARAGQRPASSRLQALGCSLQPSEQNIPPPTPCTNRWGRGRPKDVLR